MTTFANQSKSAATNWSNGSKASTTLTNTAKGGMQVGQYYGFGAFTYNGEAGWLNQTKN